jgi:radical SAM/Cys-rich protein|tara:strand:- start:3217 stop:4209 length:993 start_codon:yes stop_codon:yes gene_type:complete
MQDTRPLLLPTDFPHIRRKQIDTLQLNLGYLCNMTCSHCHVNAGPTRTEMMDDALIEQIIEFMQSQPIQSLDLTGGAPELHWRFRDLVKAARVEDIEVIDRCNLTVALEPGQEDLLEFLAEQGVTVIASLPCYSEANVNEQRGKGVFEKSIEVLQSLNKLGYGIHESRQLHLVYNPNGAFLPPAQDQLERDYKEQLGNESGIRFNQLFTITNMPIQRFGAQLIAKGKYNEYMTLLKDNYTPGNLDSLMCRSTVSVDWQGYLYDCDFNQMLEMPMQLSNGLLPSDLIASETNRTHLSDVLTADFDGTPIVIGEHCYGCTAGQGSSCGGALG